MASIALAIFWWTPLAYAEEPSPSSPVLNAHSQWSMLAGYGVTHPGLGDTRVTVKTVKIIPRYGLFLTEELGEGWYRGRHMLFVELPLEMVVEPDTAPLVSLNFLAVWQFTGHPVVNPYIFAGGGAVYTEANIPGMGSDLSGDYQYGLGAQIQRGQWAITIEGRLHHISNAGTSSPNEPLNSTQFLAGITRYY